MKCPNCGFEVEKKKRSLNANSYCWTLIHKIAKVLRSTDDEVYIDMLHKYGTKEYIACLPNIIPELKTVFKIVEVMSKSNINGKDAVTVKLIRGSSTYTSKEMASLIEMIVEECKILGIETLTPSELKSMVDNWKGV